MKNLEFRMRNAELLGVTFLVFLFFISAIPQASAQSGCCQVACPDTSVLCADSSDLSTCGAGILTSCPGGGGAPNPVSGTACTTLEACPQYTPPSPDGPAPSSESEGATPEAGTGAGAAAGATSGGALELPNPLGTADTRIVVGRIIGTLMSGIGMIGLLMFIYAGFQWLTAAGNPEKIKKGQQILLWVTIGMAIMFTAYFAVRYILLALTKATIPGGVL